MIARAASCIALFLTTAVAVADVVPVVHAPRPQTSIVLSVGQFLIDGSGRPVSPYRAFRAAIESAREQRASRLVIPPGRYIFSDPDISTSYAHILLASLSDLEIDGQGSELVFTNPAVQGIVLAEANRIVLRNFSIEYSGTLASAGVVKKLHDGRTAIRILDGFPAGPSTTFEAVSEFEIAGRRWRQNEVYGVRHAEMIAPQTFTAPEFDRFRDDTEVIVRHQVYGANAIAGFLPALNDVAFEDITVYSAPGMAFFFAATGKGIRLSRCVVKPKKDQLISTTADAAHFANTGGQIVIEDCDFSGQGDDAVNIGAQWLRAVTQVDPFTLDLAFARAPSFYPDSLVRGMELTFRSERTLQELARRRVVNVSQDSLLRRYRVVLDAPIAIDGSPLIALDSMDSSVYLLRNNRFHDHRGRGMILQAAHGRVENNLVHDSSMACLDVGAEAVTFFEGFGAADLVITGNRFEGCNAAGFQFAGGQRLGAVNILAEVPSGLADDGPHSDIAFERNDIIESPGLALLVASARRVALRDNVIVDANLQSADHGQSGSPPHHSVLITHASEVTIEGLTEHTTTPACGGGILVDPATTSEVVVHLSRRRAAGAR